MEPEKRSCPAIMSHTLEWLDIPLKDQPPNHYQLLGIKLFEADLEVIKSAAHQQMERVQSFRTDENSELLKNMLKKIATARVCLLNPAGKVEYDSSLRLILQSPSVPPPSPTPQSKPPIIKKQQLPPVTVLEKARTPNRIGKKSYQRHQINWLPYIGLGAVGVIGGILVTLFVVRDSHPNSAIPISNNQIAQVTNLDEQNLSNGLAQSGNANRDKTADHKSKISPPDAPLIDENDLTTEKQDSKLADSDETERKQTVDQSPISTAPREQSISANSEHKASTLSKNNLPSDLSQDSSQDLQADQPYHNTPLQQSRGDRLSNRSTATPSIKSQARSRYNSGNSSGSQDNKLTLNLPSGKTFNSQLFDVNLKSVEFKLKDILDDKDDNGKVISLRSPNGDTHALAEYDKGRLDGVYLAFYKDDIPMIYANYTDGSCNGVIKKWNENGERVYWCQYSKGFRNGFCCYFKDNILRILLEINLNNINAVHLCSNSELEKSFISLKKAIADEDVKILIDEVTEIESDLKKMEIAYKKQTKDVDLQLRQSKASKLNVQKRADIQERINQRGADRQEQINQLRRKGGM